jgi:hypothetical protein
MSNPWAPPSYERNSSSDFYGSPPASGGYKAATSAYNPPPAQSYYPPAPALANKPEVARAPTILYIEGKPFADLTAF